MNKSKKKKSLAIALSTLAIVLSAVSISTFARAADSGTDNQNDAARQRVEQRDEMRQAVEDGDYAKWKELEENKPKITDYINEENFSKFSEMHNLMKDGNRDEAEKIREELGLPDKGMMGGPRHKVEGRGMHRGDGSGNCPFDDDNNESQE